MNFSVGFKYRSGNSETLERDLKSLKDNSFFAASRDTLNDPFEGRFEKSMLKKQLEEIQGLFKLSITDVANSIENLLSFVDKCGIYSLSSTPLNELIWAHYGGSHFGFCIEYDIDKLYYFSESHSHIIPVTYQTNEPNLSVSKFLGASSKVESILSLILGTKSKPWEYENEFRIITSAAGSHLYDFRAVKFIYFGLRCPEKTKEQVMWELAGKNIGYRQITSPEKSYKLGYVNIDDKFKNENNNMTNNAPIADGALLPEYTDSKYKAYNDYLTKAANIVKRIPYCIEITDVNFSTNKGSVKNPVIYVRCKTKSSDYTKHYFTIKEIDKIHSEIMV